MEILIDLLVLIVYLMVIIAAGVFAFDWACSCYFNRKAKYTLDMTKFLSAIVLEASKKMEENKAMTKKNDVS